jgi:hypothetical protein
VACRPHKARILDEFCAACGHHRKAASRLLNRRMPTAPLPLRRFRKNCGRISRAQIDRPVPTQIESVFHLVAIIGAPRSLAVVQRL